MFFLFLFFSYSTLKAIFFSSSLFFFRRQMLQNSVDIDICSDEDTPSFSPLVPSPSASFGVVTSQSREEQVKSEEKKEYLVYCIQSETNPQRTYVGITNNWKRRIRQHNGQLSQGAKSTRAYRPWKPLIHVSKLNKKQALQLEWALKHKRKGGSGPRGRIVTLESLMREEKWTAKSTPLSEIGSLSVHCALTREVYVAHLPLQLKPLKKEEEGSITYYFDTVHFGTL